MTHEMNIKDDKIERTDERKEDLDKKKDRKHIGRYRQNERRKR